MKFTGEAAKLVKEMWLANKERMSAVRRAYAPKRDEMIRERKAQMHRELDEKIVKIKTEKGDWNGHTEINTSDK